MSKTAPTQADSQMSNYRAALSERIKAGVRVKAQAGGISGPAPLGYRNTQSSAVEIDPTTAPLVKESFQLLCHKGRSVRQALQEMTSRGMRSKRGKPLSVASFYLLITNPFYAGYVRLNGELYPGSHEPLISPELFWQVQGKLRDR